VGFEEVGYWLDHDQLVGLCDLGPISGNPQVRGMIEPVQPVRHPDIRAANRAAREPVCGKSCGAVWAPV